MRAIDTRTSVPFEGRIRDADTPTDTDEQIEARAEELNRTIGDNEARRDNGNTLVNPPSKASDDALGIPSAEENAEQLRTAVLNVIADEGAVVLGFPTKAGDTLQTVADALRDLAAIFDPPPVSDGIVVP